MELIFDVLVVIGVVLFSVMAGKNKTKNAAKKSASVPNQPRGEYTKPAQSGADIFHKDKPAAGGLAGRTRQAAADWRRQLYEADRDRHYDHESLDYCDSDIPASGGITFRNLPEGTDELQYLRRWNSSRERMLEKALETRE